jgi:hypothetical protein
MTALTEPRALAETLAALVDLLLPGDELFPPASTVGVQAKLADRLIELRDPGVISELVRQLSGLVATSGRLDRAAVERFERAHPEEFLLIRNLAYLAYYESPAVHEAIRAMGFTYHAVPLPAGYEVGKFDPASELPRHGRGRFVRTEEVRRVDLSQLDFLRPRP